jgi:hypothetical protein
MSLNSNSKTLLAWALMLVACDLGKTNLGDLNSEATDDGDAETTDDGGSETTDDGDAETTDGGGAGCTVEWGVSPAVRDGDWTTAHAVLALDDGFVLGATPSSGDVTRVDADGVTQWTAELGVAGQAFVKDVLLDHDGGYVAAIADYDPMQPSGQKLRAVRLSPSGEPEWDIDLGEAHYMAWMEADVLLHPDGGTVVSWHDNEPRLVLARLDEQGGVAWTAAHSLAAGSATASNFVHGAAALLGDGSILQLTTEGVDPRLVRTAADGSPVSDAVVEDVGLPIDLTVLPDGTILLLTNYTEVMVLEVEPDGTVVSTRGFWGGDGSFGDVMAWDPTYDALVIGGSARDEDMGWERPWTLVVDLDGNELYNALELDEPNGPTSALDVSRIPSGGFVVSRHGGSLYYETVLPCAEG